MWWAISGKSRWVRTVRMAGAALWALALSSRAAVIYQEDFSDVSDWVLVYNDQGGAATLTSDGSLGSFYIGAMNNFAAFVPYPGMVPLAPFNPTESSYQYYLGFEVVGLTDSTSYSIEIDEFDGSQNYLATVFSVVPQGTFVGSNRVSLAGLPWNPAAAYILPKVTMYTGLGDQTVVFNSMELDLVVLPEPSSLILVVIGAVILRHRRLVGPFVEGRAFHRKDEVL